MMANPLSRVRMMAMPVSFALLMTTAPVHPGVHGHAPQQATFRTSVEAVRVDVLVTADGRPVRGLTADKFEVLDDGVRQRVTAALFEQLPVNVTLALDVSNSLAGPRLSELREAGRVVISQLRPDDRVSVVTFSESLAVPALPTSDFTRVRGALDGMRPGGGTRLFDAVHAGLVLADSDVRRNLLIVFSDGADTSSVLTLADIVATGRRADVVVYAVVAGLPGRRSELHEISTQTGGDVLEIEKAKSIDTIFRNILDEFRQRYLLMYTPTGVKRGGWHPIEVRVKGGRGAVKARPGYEAGPAR